MTTRRFVPAALALVLLLSLVSEASARTIELTAADCDRMACIGPQSQRAGWLMHELGAGEFSTLFLDLKADRAFLIRYPLDRIPAGQRITRAEWILPITVTAPAGEQRVHVRRIVGAWGAGVCHQYRMLRPEKRAWTVPGAAGIATDRAAQATAVARCNGAGEQAINVTEDVELWYTGASENNGWILTVEDPGALVRLASPLWIGNNLLRLRITYEPE